jgi:cytochrome c peroxidase
MLVACGHAADPATTNAGGSPGASGTIDLAPTDAGRAGGGAAGQAATNDDDPDPELSEDARAALSALSPRDLPVPAPDATNAFADDATAATLGQALFFDARFSGALLDGDNDGSVNALGNKGDTGKVACAGCHLPEAGFSDARSIRQQISLGSGWGLRRAPSLLDVGQSRLLMWDGRRDSLFSQVFGPLESAVEMNSSRLYAAQQIFLHYKAEYEAIFGALPPLDEVQRFPALSALETGCRKLDSASRCEGTARGAPGDGAEYDALSTADQTAVTRVWVNVGKAIGAYERGLSCGPGRFDAFVQGDAQALTRAEQRGAAIFVGKGHCNGCHSGPYLSDEQFHNVGLQPQVVATVFLDANDAGASRGLLSAQQDELNAAGPYSDGDDGRLPKELAASLLGAFRTPRLRCAAGRPSFMHTGQLVTLGEVVDFFARGGDHFGFPGENELFALELSPRERADLVAFLGALSGPGPPKELLSPPLNPKPRP